MKLGMHCSRFNWPGGSQFTEWPGGPGAMGSTLATIARRLDEAGFYSLSVMDHFFQIPPVGPVDWEMNEAYTTLGYVAGVTERLHLGTIVTGVTYRHPGILVKQVTTLDVLSGGRAWFGVGAAWFEREHRGLGIPFPPLKERFERLEETLQIAHRMWSGEGGAYQGQHYQLEEMLCSPLPLQRPHPPIMVGGGGEQKTLRLVARYADACNLFANDGPEPVRHKLDVLRGHCETEGREYDAIEKTVNSRLFVTRDGANGSETPAQAVARFRELAKLGVTWASCGIPNAHEDGALELIGREVVPALAEL